MYKYFNPNTVTTSAGDCVIRAICKIFNTSWTSTYAALCLQGYQMGDWGNSNAVWDAYLRSNGFKRYIIPNTCPDCYTVEEFCDDHPTGSYILATGTHVVAVVKGDYYDEWDSGTEIPIYYYYREEEAN